MRGDTVKQAVQELLWEDEIGTTMPDGIERMLQGSDLEFYQQQLAQESRERWLHERGLTENDVYGRHANPRPIEPNDGLYRLVVNPKGMIEFELYPGEYTRDPDYEGEHRRPKNTFDYPDGMVYMSGVHCFQVDGDYPDELIAWLEEECEDDSEPTKGYVAQ